MEFLKVVIPSLLIIIGGVVSWFLKSKSEELMIIEKKLREQQWKTYNAILEPYIRVFASLKNSDNMREAVNKINSYEYKKTAFNLNLFGSDKVVRAYNALMQHFYHVNVSEPKNSKKIMSLWGKFLLTIRKDLGNKKTKLKLAEMLESMITDINEVLK